MWERAYSEVVSAFRQPKRLMLTLAGLSTQGAFSAVSFVFSSTAFGSYAGPLEASGAYLVADTLESMVPVPGGTGLVEATPTTASTTIRIRRRCSSCGYRVPAGGPLRPDTRWLGSLRACAPREDDVRSARAAALMALTALRLRIEPLSTCHRLGALRPQFLYNPVSTLARDCNLTSVRGAPEKGETGT